MSTTRMGLTVLLCSIASTVGASGPAQPSTLAVPAPCPGHASGEEVYAQLKGFVDGKGFELDDLGSEGGQPLVAFLVPAEVGASTASEESFLRAIPYVEKAIQEDIAARFIERVGPSDLSKYGRFTPADAPRPHPFGEEGTPSVLDYLVELIGDEITPAVDLLRGLTNVRAIVLGTGDQGLYPALIVGTTLEGAVVGLRSYVVWT